MDDPRLDERHLTPPRREQYLRARDELFGSLGQTTGDVEKTIQGRLPFGFVPQPARYALRDMRSGHFHLLRVGINTIGRHADNDIVLGDNPISRRHCVIVIHTNGRVEVRDMASRHGVQLGRQPVGQAELAPGDILRLCDNKFMLLAEPPEKTYAPFGTAQDTGDCGATGTGWRRPNPLLCRTRPRSLFLVACR